MTHSQIKDRGLIQDRNRYEALSLISKSAVTSAFPILMLPLAVFQLSQIPQVFPVAFWSATMGVISTLLVLFFLGRQFPQVPRATVSVWEWQFGITRAALYSFTSIFFVLGYLTEESGQTWISFVLFAVWISTIENICSTYSSRLYMARGHLFLFSVLTLGYGWLLSTAIAHALGLFAIIYVAIAYLKINRFHQQFLEFSQLITKIDLEKDKLEELLDIIPLNLAWISPEKKYIHVNNNLALSLGLSKYQFIGQPIGFMHGTETPFYKKIIDFTQSETSILQYQSKLETPDKSPLWLEFIYRKLEHPHQDELIVVSRDITAQKLIEEQMVFERLSKVESARLASLGEMAAGIAHEINNPLSIIAGRAESIIEELGKPEISKEFVLESSDKINRTVLRISKIIKSMKNLSRDGKNDPFERAQLFECVQHAAEISPERLRLLNAKLTVEVPPNIFIWCRPVQISQILVNLLNNSLDAISELKERWIKIHATKTGNVVTLSVEDSGTGIPIEIRQKLMQPFFTTKPPGQGTGLGLSLTRHVMEEHHGEFYYDESCQNTRFIIKIPTHGLSTLNDETSPKRKLAS